MSDLSLSVEYKTILHPKITNAVEDSLRTEVATKCVELIKQSADTNLYGAYTPSGQHKYERRFSYLKDGAYETDANGLTLTISENIHGQGNAENLTEVLEAGTPYEWTRSEIFKMQPYPRPFFGKAIDDGIASGEIDTALSNGMKSRGF